MPKSGLMLCVALMGCGYRFTTPNSALPKGVDKVAVPVFKNNTSEPAAEALFTDAMRELYLRADKLGDEHTETFIEGTVLSITSNPLVSSPGRLPNYRVTIVVSLRLMRGPLQLGAIVVSGGEEFPSGADLLWAETWRGAAVRRIAESMMREGAERLATGW
jgi:hypothetical protein